jgi:hypothetical protein
LGNRREGGRREPHVSVPVSGSASTTSYLASEVVSQPNPKIKPTEPIVDALADVAADLPSETARIHSSLTVVAVVCTRLPPVLVARSAVFCSSRKAIRRPGVRGS